MVKHIIVYWDDSSSHSKIQNMVYENMTKTEAIQHFEDEFGVKTFPIINIIEL